MNTENIENLEEAISEETCEFEPECCELCEDSSSMWMVLGIAAIGAFAADLAMEGIKKTPTAIRKTINWGKNKMESMKAKREAKKTKENAEAKAVDENQNV